MFHRLRDTLTKHSRWMVFLFFTAYLVIGLAVYDDYGISTDEEFQIRKAEINLDFMTGKNTDLLEYPDRHYGAVLAIPLYFIGNWLGDTRADYLFRHLTTFLIFFGSSIIFYRLARLLNFSRSLALAGTAIYIFHPHLFSHSFYNIKDIPFLSLYLLDLYLLVCWVKKPGWGYALLSGLGSGLLVVFRLPGFLLWATAFMLWAWLFLLSPRLWKRHLFTGSVYALSAILALYVFMPALWLDPLNELRVFISAELFTWPHKEIFIGQLIEGYAIPRYYLPVYFAVTTPLLWLGLALIGSLVSLYQLFIKKQILDSAAIGLALPFFGFYFPLLAIMLIRPVIYNGWRHAFFIYPGFVLLVLFGIRACLAGIHALPRRWIRRLSLAALVILAVFQVAEQARFLVISHPYQHVYYNRLAGESLSEARRLYAMDYWGLSYRQALEAILEMDDRPEIRVLGYHPLLAQQNLRILTPDQRQRIVIVQKGEPYDYFIHHFRNDFQEVFPDREMVYSINIDGALINAVYRFIP